MANATELAMLDGPALTPPPGVAVDFDEVGYLNYAFPVLALLIIAPSLALAVRLYTKFFIIRQAKPEDYICIIAYIFFVVFLAVGDAAGLKAGGNRHIWNVRLRDFMAFQLLNYVSLLMYAIAIFLVKTSILMQYMRVFAPDKESIMWRTIYIMIAANFLFYIAILFHAAFLCSPTEKFWNPFIHGECMDLGSTYITSAVFSAATDIAILLLPQHAIWRLRMPTKQKLGVSAVFLIGLGACSCSIAQIYYSVMFSRTTDVTYEIGRPSGWFSQAEIAMGIICSCLPVTPRFFKTLNQCVARWRQSRPASWYGWRRSNFTSDLPVSSSDKSQSTWRRHSSMIYSRSKGQATNWSAALPDGEDGVALWDGKKIPDRSQQILRTVEIEAVQSPKGEIGRPVSPPEGEISVAPWEEAPPRAASRQVWRTVRIESVQSPGGSPRDLEKGATADEIELGERYRR